MHHWKKGRKMWSRKTASKNRKLVCDKLRAWVTLIYTTLHVEVSGQQIPAGSKMYLYLWLFNFWLLLCVCDSIMCWSSGLWQLSKSQDTKRVLKNYVYSSSNMLLYFNMNLFALAHKWLIKALSVSTGDVVGVSNRIELFKLPHCKSRFFFRVRKNT